MSDIIDELNAWPSSLTNLQLSKIHKRAVAEIRTLRDTLSRVPHTEDGVAIVMGMRLWQDMGDVGGMFELPPITGYECRPDGTLRQLYWGDGFCKCLFPLWADPAKAKAEAAKGGV